MDLSLLHIQEYRAITLEASCHKRFSWLLHIRSLHLPECGATSLVDCVPDVSCHDDMVVSSSVHLTLEDVSNMPLLNVGNQSPSEVAPLSGKMETSSAPSHKLNTVTTFVRRIQSRKSKRRHKYIIQFNIKM